MRIDAFIAECRRSRDGLAMLEGALHYERVDPQLGEDDRRRRLLAAKLELERAAK